MFLRIFAQGTDLAAAGFAQGTDLDAAGFAQGTDLETEVSTSLSLAPVV